MNTGNNVEKYPQTALMDPQNSLNTSLTQSRQQLAKVFTVQTEQNNSALPRARDSTSEQKKSTTPELSLKLRKDVANSGA